MSAESLAVDEYIKPLHQAWNRAVRRFLDLEQEFSIPDDHPYREGLRLARQQLQPNTMIDDELVRTYIKILEGLFQQFSLTNTFIDPIITKMFLEQPSKFPPKALKEWTGSEERGHIFWVIHDPKNLHWSLAHMNLETKRIIAYDSCLSLNPYYALDAAHKMAIHWETSKLDIDDVPWKIQTSPWDIRAGVQADGSHDGGVLVMLLTRRLQGEGILPILPENDEERKTLMGMVGMRMRLRMAAEIIAGQGNPSIDQIPAWLK